MGEAGELLGIAEDELQLEAGSIKIEDVSCRHRCVCREEDLASLTLLLGVPEVDDDDSDIAAKADGIDDGSVHLAYEFADSGVVLGED